MAAAEVISDVRPRAISVRWIIGPRADLVWFIGSVLSSYALLFLYLKEIIPLIPMVAVWAVFIDAPHVFGTFSRTYFDRAERHHRGPLLWGSLLFFFVGPMLVLLGAGLVFFFLAAVWAYYHLVKQHYGFMVLYKKKNDDLAPVDNALDRLLLLFAFNYPFVAFIAADREAMMRVPGVLHSGISQLAGLLLAGTIVVGIVWLGRQVQRAISGERLDLPKYLLLAAAIPMHWIVLLTPMPHKPIAIVAILTIYHNLQYHRLIWFHNQKYKSQSRLIAGHGGLYGRADSPSDFASGIRKNEANTGQIHELRQKYGAAELISRRLSYYIAFGIIFGIIYQGPRQLLGYIALRSGQAPATTEQSLLVQLGISFLWGYAFIHYYLDSKIWRVRRDPAVGRALKMD